MTIETYAGKITATKETLNWLAVALIHAEENRKEHGRYADPYHTVWNQIYDALNESKYYDKVKEA